MTRPSKPSSLDSFVKAVADALEAHTAALFLVSGRQEQRLELAAWHSLSSLVLEEAVLRPGQGFIGWVFRQGRPLHVTRFDKDSATLGIYREDAGIKAMMAVPLPDGAGVLAVDSRNRYQFPEKSLKVLESMAQVAYELWVSDREVRRAGLWDALLGWLSQCCLPGGGQEGVDPLEELTQILGLDLALHVLQLPGGRHYRIAGLWPDRWRRPSAHRQKISVECGLAGWILRHRRDIILDRFGRDREVSHLIGPDDGLDAGSVVVGCYIPPDNGGGVGGPGQAVIFMGRRDLSWWPSDLAKVVSCLITRSGILQLEM